MPIPIDSHSATPAPARQLHTPLLRNELEIATARTNPDIEHEMQCCLHELPMLCEWMAHSKETPDYIAPLMAWCIEAGYRYALLECLSILDRALDTPFDGATPSKQQASPQIPVLGTVGPDGTITCKQPLRQPTPMRHGYAATHSAEDAAEHNALLAWVQRAGYQPAETGTMSDEEAQELARRLAATPHREPPPPNAESQPKSYPNGLSEKFNQPAIAEFNITFERPKPNQPPICGTLTERVNDFTERRAGFGRRETDQPLNYISTFQRLCREAAAADQIDDCCRDI